MVCVCADKRYGLWYGLRKGMVCGMGQSQEHHTNIARRREALKKGSARRSFLNGRERAIVNETNVGSVSKATLGELLKGGVERIRSFREHRYHLELN